MQAKIYQSDYDDLWYIDCYTTNLISIFSKKESFGPFDSKLGAEDAAVSWADGIKSELAARKDTSYWISL